MSRFKNFLFICFFLPLILTPPAKSTNTEDDLGEYLKGRNLALGGFGCRLPALTDDIVSRCVNAENLSINGYCEQHGSTEPPLFLETTLGSLSNLVHLRLFNHRNLTGEHITFPPNLKTLEITDCPIVDESLDNLPITLMEITLTTCENITNEGIKTIGLKKIPTVNLQCTSEEITGEAIGFLGDVRRLSIGSLEKNLWNCPVDVLMKIPYLEIFYKYTLSPDTLIALCSRKQLTLNGIVWYFIKDEYYTKDLIEGLHKVENLKLLSTTAYMGYDLPILFDSLSPKNLTVTSTQILYFSPQGLENIQSKGTNLTVVIDGILGLELEKHLLFVKKLVFKQLSHYCVDEMFPVENSLGEPIRHSHDQIVQYIINNSEYLEHLELIKCFEITPAILPDLMKKNISFVVKDCPKISDSDLKELKIPN